MLRQSGTAQYTGLYFLGQLPPAPVTIPCTCKYNRRPVSKVTCLLPRGLDRQ